MQLAPRHDPCNPVAHKLQLQHPASVFSGKTRPRTLGRAPWATAVTATVATACWGFCNTWREVYSSESSHSRQPLPFVVTSWHIQYAVAWGLETAAAYQLTLPPSNWIRSAVVRRPTCCGISPAPFPLYLETDSLPPTRTGTAMATARSPTYPGATVLLILPARSLLAPHAGSELLYF